MWWKPARGQECHIMKTHSGLRYKDSSFTWYPRRPSRNFSFSRKHRGNSASDVGMSAAMQLLLATEYMWDVGPLDNTSRPAAESYGNRTRKETCTVAKYAWRHQGIRPTLAVHKRPLITHGTEDIGRLGRCLPTAKTYTQPCSELPCH